MIKGGNKFMFDLKNIDKNTIKIEAKDIKDNSIYELEEIRERLDTYNIKKMTWFEYDYEPYYSWGERPTKNPLNRNYEDYHALLDRLIQNSIDDRRRGWSNKINFLNITLELEEESSCESDELNKKLDFIVNLLFDIYCHSDIHYVELLGGKLGRAEKLGFNIEPSKTWDYDVEQYEFYRKNEED